MESCFDLTALDEHGAVYGDSQLGGIAVAQGLDKICYIAEAKPEPKNVPFLKPHKKGENEKARFGQEYAYAQDHGEQVRCAFYPACL